MMIIMTMIIIMITVFRGVFIFVRYQDTCQIIVFLCATLQVIQDACNTKLCADLVDTSREQDD